MYAMSALDRVANRLEQTLLTANPRRMFVQLIHSGSVQSADHMQNPHQHNHTRAVARAVNVNASNVQESLRVTDSASDRL